MPNQEYKNVTKTKRVITIDGNTGECLGEEVESTSQSIEKEPPFIKLYLSDIVRINDIPKGMDKILFSFVKRMNYGDNIVFTYKPIKQMIANELNIGLDYVNASIKEFKKKGIFIAVARGIYMIDPELFGKGRWKEVKQLRLLVEYKGDGTKKLISSLSTEFEEKVKQLSPKNQQKELSEEFEKAINPTPNKKTPYVQKTIEQEIKEVEAERLANKVKAEQRDEKLKEKVKMLEYDKKQHDDNKGPESFE